MSLHLLYTPYFQTFPKVSIYSSGNIQCSSSDAFQAHNALSISRCHLLRHPSHINSIVGGQKTQARILLRKLYYHSTCQQSFMYISFWILDNPFTLKKVSISLECGVCGYHIFWGRQNYSFETAKFISIFSETYCISGHKQLYCKHRRMTRAWQAIGPDAGALQLVSYL